MLLFASSCGSIIIPKDNRFLLLFCFVFYLDGLGFCLCVWLVGFFFKVSDTGIKSTPACLVLSACLEGRSHSSHVCECTEALGWFCLYCGPCLVEPETVSGLKLILQSQHA